MHDLHYKNYILSSIVTCKKQGYSSFMTKGNALVLKIMAEEDI